MGKRALKPEPRTVQMFLEKEGPKKSGREKSKIKKAPGCPPKTKKDRGCKWRRHFLK